MKRTALLAALCLLPTSLFAQQAKPSKVEFQNDQQAMSYGIGVNIGRSLVNDRVDGDIVDTEWIAKGISDVLEGRTSALSDEQFMQAMEKLQKILEAKREQEKQAAAKKNEAFLEKKKSEGFMATRTGLLYKVVKEGTGERPKRTDLVKVHYRGTFPDGTEFDSSYEQNEPLVREVQGFIDGWVEALQMMKVGGRWQLVVPPDLAYGEEGVQGIPPHSVLMFELELLGIEEPQE